MSYIDYQKKIVSLAKAAESVESGDVIWIGSALSIPITFLDKLADRVNELQNVTLVGAMFICNHHIFTDEKYNDTFKIICIVGRQIMPNSMENVHFVYRTEGSVIENVCKKYGVNVLAVEVRPTETRGICSFGAFGTYMTPCVNRYDAIKKRIVVINNFQPEGGKDRRNFIDLSLCDNIVINHHKFFGTNELG